MPRVMSGIEAVELLEHPRLLGLRDPEALVADREAHWRRRARPDAHVAAVGRVLDRVVDQVAEHLPELARVGGDAAASSGRLELD